MLLLLLGFSVVNPDLVIKTRQNQFSRMIRDIAYSVNSDSFRISYQWMRGLKNYRLGVHKLEGNRYKKTIYVFKSDTLFRIIKSGKSARVDIISPLEDANLFAHDWLMFLPHYVWTKKGNPAEISFNYYGADGKLYLAKDGKILKVMLHSPKKDVLVSYTNYVNLKGFKNFPTEWDISINGHKRHFKVENIFLNRGMCGSCTFKIPPH